MQIIRTPSASSAGLPSQGGHGGKYLTTDGTVASWASVGGGTGFDGIVTTHASLPTALGSPAVNAIYLVRESTGLWFVNRKQRGLWQRIANAGALADWQYMGEWLEEFSDANVGFYNNADNTKSFGFDVSGVSTGTKRTATVPNKNFTMAGLDDVPAYSDANPSGPGTAAQGSSPKVSRQDHVHPRQTAITNAEIDTAAAIALSKLATDPLARANHTGTQTAATISDFDTQVRTSRLDQMAAPTASVGLNSQKITSLADGTSSGDAVNRGQLDANATADRARANHTGTQTAATISDFDTQVRTSRLDQMVAPNTSLSMASQKIVNVTDPTSAQDAATKSYVDALVNGIAPKESVRAGTTANISLSGAQTIDGVSVIAADRVLVKNQSAGAENGIYVAAAGAWSRATDADSAADILSAFCFVEEGSTLADTAWVMTTNAAITLGTTALTWVQFGTSATIADDSVTNAKLANMAASTIKARKTGSTGDPEDCTLSEVLDFIGSAAQGDILYRGASAWARLAAGTSGQFLKTLGAAANPAWDTPAGSTPTTTEGDIIVRGASSDQRLAVGSNNQVLTVDTSVSGKLKWAAGGGGGAVDPDEFRKNPLYATDCFSASTTQLYPFIGSTIQAGSISAPATYAAQHPGLVAINSSTNANSGLRVNTSTISNSNILIQGKEWGEFIFNVTALTNLTLRLGFHDCTSSADAVDGAYIEIVSSGVATGKTSDNSTRSSTGTTYTISAATWYRCKIAINSGATSVTFTIYNDSGTALWSETLSTNIPTASGRETGFGLIATNSGTSAVEMLLLDYMALGFSPGLTR